MKKIFTLIIMASMTLKATAQLDNGFYRIQNTNTERYIVMYDPYVLVNKATVTVALDALQTITSWNTVRSHMGSVWYIESKGDSQYDLYCQHSSLGANSDGFYPSIFYNDGAYRIYGEYSGLTPGQKVQESVQLIKEKNISYSILIMHEPDYINEIEYENFDLILAGHSHNGQVRLPFIGAIVLPPHAEEYYDEYYKINNTDLYISSGIGTSNLKFRLFNRPSFNLYRIVTK
jgi:predicted MPP superfamily phosphohydrolase